MESSTPIKIVRSVNLNFKLLSSTKINTQNIIEKHVQRKQIIHWPYKELKSEQLPSDHIDKLASKQSVDQKDNITCLDVAFQTCKETIKNILGIDK